MKVDYIIWLKDGRCINGHADKEAINDLISAWEDTTGHFRSIYELSDDDGRVFVMLSEIDAIAKNKPEDMAKSGF